MIHGHVYVDGFVTTKNKTPCGALEEVDEILDLLPHAGGGSFCVNLMGHGFLAACDHLEYFDYILAHLKSRPFLEGE